MARSVTVRVPASSANMGSGFDSLGIALDLTCDIRLTLHDSAAPYPGNRAEQLALAAARAVFAQARRSPSENLQAEFRSTIPVGRGLGVSAVLRVGAVLAANRLLDDPFSADEALVIATELEGHADNAAPALFGGFQVVVWNDGALSRVEVPLPAELQIALLIPELEMPTNESRRLLPVEVTRHEAVYNIGRAALLVAALATGKLEALRIATQDILHQPARARLFPALFDVIDAAINGGAHGAYLSGGGSAVLALTTGNTDAIGRAMLAACERGGTGGSYIVTRPRSCGAQIIADEVPA
jgi:homoserine kinase